jgi:hypothetical protein
MIYRAGTQDQKFSKEKDRIQNEGKLENETMHSGDASSYVRCALSTAIKYKHNCNKHTERKD